MQARVTPLRDTQCVTRLFVLLAAFILLGLIYSVTTPVFESPDEPWHFNYVRYIAQGHGLPSLLNNDSGAYQEVGQPPLYYLIAGLATAPFQPPDMRGFALHNPGFGYQAPGTVNDNKNLLIHTERESLLAVLSEIKTQHAAQNPVLAIRLARLVSLAFGALTVLATWGLTREAFPSSPVAAAAFVALTPQFVFMSSVASNDSSAAALSTAALWAIARMVRRGVTAKRALWTGMLIGLASLTKTSTILLGVFAIAAILVRPLTADKRQWSVASGRRSVVGGQWLTAVMLAIAAFTVGGWWYARNGILYGDPLGLRVHLNTPWARPAQVSLAQVIPSLPLMYRSFWGAFGWGNVEMSPVVYYAIAAVLVASMVGWIFDFVCLARSASKAGSLSQTHGTQHAMHNTHPVLLMCLLWCAAVFVSLLRWNQHVEAPHGRLLFPAIGAFAVLLIAGLARLPRPRLVLSIVLAGFSVLALAVPFVYIRPAYAWPELVPVDQIAARRPALVVRRLVYGDQAQLIGYALDRSSVSPGEWLNVTLCWTAVRPMTRNYTVFVHLLGRANLIVGARNTWPGLGRFPTTLWPPGRAFCDMIPVRVETWAPVPQLYALEVGLYDAETDDRLEAVDMFGAAIVPPVIDRVRIAPRQPLPVSPQHTMSADFDGRAALIGFDVPQSARPGDVILLRLYWRAQSILNRDYTVFVHLLDDSNRLIAQADSQPRDGAYPTSAWAVGDVIPDDHTLSLPAGLASGAYTLRVGLYLAPDGPRLPLKSQAGDALTLGTLQVR